MSRDAQGNVLAIYQKKDNNFTWKKQHLYGSSRLGIWKAETRIQGTYKLNVAAMQQSVREYELTNHLGNVLSTITDKGVITSAQDYFPFGLTLASRSFTEGGSVYRYSFNGKEDDKELKQVDFGNRMYRRDLGRFNAVDKFQKKYSYLSPYHYAGNTPLMAKDNDGDYLIVIAGKDEIEKFKSVLQTAFSGKIAITVDERGIVTMTGDASKLTAREKVLYDQFYTVTKTDVPTNVTFVHLIPAKGGIGDLDRENIATGRFRGMEIDLSATEIRAMNAIDIYDVENIPKTGGTSPEGFLLHEIWETYFDQNQTSVNDKKDKEKSFNAAHDAAFIEGSKLEGVTILGNYGSEAFAKGTGKSYLPYKDKEGKFFTTIINYENGDVKSGEVKSGVWLPVGKGEKNVEGFTKAQIDQVIKESKKN